jgi:hypothetical protein
MDIPRFGDKNKRHIMTTNSVQISFRHLWVGVVFFSLCSYSRLNQNNPYKQIRIPLDTLKGVPFSKGEEGYVVNGFDVDSNENFYFVGGRKTTLACFSKYGEAIYRKYFRSFHPGPVHILGKRLYLYETWNWTLNNLIELDKASGTIIRKYPNTITNALKSRGFKSIDDYRFSDSALSITYIDSEGVYKPKTICFNLKGELLPDRNQCLPNCSSVEKDTSREYLGKLGNDYVFGKFNDDGKTYDLSLKDSLNTIVSDASVELKYLGRPLCGFSCLPQEHRKLRNNKLYMLNRYGKMAVITEIDLATTFHSR